MNVCYSQLCPQHYSLFSLFCTGMYAVFSFSVSVSASVFAAQNDVLIALFGHAQDPAPFTHSLTYVFCLFRVLHRGLQESPSPTLSFRTDSSIWPLASYMREVYSVRCQLILQLNAEWYCQTCPKYSLFRHSVPFTIGVLPFQDSRSNGIEIITHNIRLSEHLWDGLIPAGIKRACIPRLISITLYCLVHI